MKKVFFRRFVKPAKYLVVGLIFIFLLWQFSQSRITSLHYLDCHGVKQALNLPVKDKKKLAGLMENLFGFDNFAYTILGSKPVSWASYWNPLPFSSWSHFFHAFSKSNRIVRSGWKTWQKYQHLFPSAHFWKESSKTHPDVISILIVNENQLNAVVEKNKKDFQTVLGLEIKDGSQLIRESKNRSLMNEVLTGHQALIGIVLGYGRENSWKFHEGCKTHTPIGWVWEENEYFGDVTCSEKDTLYYYLSRYSCPSFSGDPNSEESLALKKEYLLTKQKVLDYYKDKDFLEATLSLLAGYHPQN